MQGSLSSLDALLLNWLMHRSEQPLFLWDNQPIMPQEAVQRVVQLARWLQDELAITPGSRLAVLGFNRVETLLLLFAAAHCRALTVLLNARYSLPEVAAVLADASASVLFYDDNLGEQAQGASAQLENSPHLIALDDLHTVMGRFGSSLDDAVQELRGKPESLSSPVLMLYTSGTTGALKGVPLTEGNLLANIAQIGAVVPPEPHTEALVVTPFFHAAIVPAVLVPMAYGLTLVIHEKFNPHDVVATLAQRPVTWTVMVPTMIQACLDQLGGEQLPCAPHSRRIYYGASPAPQALLTEAMTVLDAQLIQSYGLTEATQAVTILSPTDHQAALAGSTHLLRSAGQPVPDTELAIWNTAGTPLPPRELGEIVVRGPQVMHGYWNRPEETAQTLIDGWLKTGDVGFVDDQGYLYVTDRIKDIIISGGENVFSARVEDILRSHPAVREVAVVGLPHPVWGETVHAVVVLRPTYAPSWSLATELVQHCRKCLAGFEIPRSFEFVTDLPKSATGKVLKRLLRNRDLQEISIYDFREPAH